MNKIGTLDIIKAYLGNKELTANNAYIGELPLINTPIIDDRLRFVALEDNSVIGLVQKSTVYSVLQYSLDGDNWNDLTTSSSITMNTGDQLFIRGKMTGNGGRNVYNNFSISGKVEVKGKIMYLYDYENIESNIVYTYTFRRLFYDCSGLIDAKNLIFPDTLPTQCCASMFNNCDNLLYAPALTATSIGDYCYNYMFENCTSLTTAPELSATTLANYCYTYMFSGCTGLTTVPELPATTLKLFCYLYMFNGCTGLTTVPSNMLPATTLASSSCYYGMFLGCTSLTNAPELPATTLKNSCYRLMFLGCTSLTTAPELPATILDGVCYRLMFLGCTSLTTAPELPATTLAASCYYGMFLDCSLLNKIITYAADISALACLTDWVSGVAATGDFYNLGGATYPSGTSGIPSGWTEHTSL